MPHTCRSCGKLEGTNVHCEECRYVGNVKQMIDDACTAEEMYELDELEAFANALRESGKTPQIKPGDDDDLAELIED